MATFVKVLTGDETARFGFRGTDLGFTARTNHGYCISIFGDTFDQPIPENSTGWRSPVGLRQSNPDIENGIRWDNCIGGGRAKEMIPYGHADEWTARNEPGQPFTEIPNDLIHLPDDRYMMTTFGVRDWAVPPNGIKSPGGSWRTWYSRLWTSTETHAEHWSRTWNLETNRENMDYWNYGDLWSHFQNNSMIMWPGEPWVYIYGTNEGRWNGGGIHLMRVPWDKMWNPGEYRFWGQDGSGTWDWRPNGPSTPILMPTWPGDPVGEISGQEIEGKAVLSYVDGRLGAVTRSSPRPEGHWTGPQIQVTQATPSIYAPIVHPYSTLGRAQILLSQWIDPGNSKFYGVKQWSGSINTRRLAARGATSERLGTTSGEPVFAGHRGPLAPQLHRLPPKERVAILQDNCDDDVSPDHIAASAHGGVPLAAGRSAARRQGPKR